MRPRLRVLPAGASAVLVETADGAQAMALHAELLRRREMGGEQARVLAGVEEIVPAARTVLVTGLADPRGFAREVVRWDVPAVPAGRGRTVELAVRFDGPDLGEVAERWGVRPGEVADVVVATSFRVAFCGFAPGFGYLTGLPERLHVSRRATPRTAVPAGSVALAGPYAGVYPRASPGGWRIVGTTRAVLWDPARDPAALLSPGVEVRFTVAR